MKKTALLLLLGLITAPVYAAEGSFAEWLAAFRAEAQQKGITEQTLQALDGLQPEERTITQDQSQPEHKLTFATYRKNILSAARIKKGKALYAAHKKELAAISKTYGVPGKYIVALWGIESSFGAQKGGYPVLQALATLAYDGRRATFFRGELLAALRILDQGHIGVETLRGSWAGAMGQCQFMPSTYLNYAVDGDDDGVSDIWDNQLDVFASMANYLRAEGWKRSMGWGVAVEAHKPLAEEMIGLKAQGHSYAAWQKLGVKLRKGARLAAPATRLYYLVQPDGAAGPSYLVTDNYQAVMRWNRSTYFATAVGLLADSIAP